MGQYLLSLLLELLLVLGLLLPHLHRRLRRILRRYKRSLPLPSIIQNRSMHQRLSLIIAVICNTIHQWRPRRHCRIKLTLPSLKALQSTTHL
jgi:hypothetical protein